MTTLTTALQLAADTLGHPMGNRATDPFLAAAVLSGHLGRRPSRDATRLGTLTEGLTAQRPGMLRSAWDALLSRTTTPRTSRRWYLRRIEQVDQGATPWCVDATRKHWELAVPTISRQGKQLGEMYARCKEIDGWPGEDGTSAEAMLTVCQREGIVASHWWWAGPQDEEAARRWLLDVGPLWFGAGWPESAFRTDQTIAGLVKIEGPLLYGHETLVIGYTPSFHGLGPAVEICNSWGLDAWGLLGRGWILEPDFWRMMYAGGDLVGVTEARR